MQREDADWLKQRNTVRNYHFNRRVKICIKINTEYMKSTEKPDKG